jgi:hypothetical protein
MKQLWQVVLAMVRCWNMLLLLKLANGFEDVVISMEGRTLGPLRLEHGLSLGRMDAATNAGSGAGPNNHV